MCTLPRSLRRAAALGLVAAAGAAVASSPAAAAPVRGNTPWSVVMCRYSDSTGAPPLTISGVRKFLVASGTGGAADYFRDQSYGEVKFTGSVVRGWYRSTMSVAQSRASNDRGARISACLDGARTAPVGGYTVPAGHRTIVMMDQCVDSGSSGGRVLLDPCAPDLAFATHEMGHGYGLDHSYSNDPNYRNVSWAQIGEYDDEWDLMSAMHSFGFDGSYTGSGPDLVADQRDKMGWIAGSKILTFGADGTVDADVPIAPLDRPTASGYQLVRIPYDPANPRLYYTVELAVKRGWNAGIPATTVLFHKVRATGRPELQRDLTRADRPPMERFSDPANDVRMTLLSSSDNGAVVRIHSGLAKRCLVGYVWRAASPSDLVCVTGQVRAATAADNAAAASRRQPGGGAYGPDTCLNGYVWRDAFPGDHVCVTGAVRDRTRTENATAASRANPARNVFGPNTCKTGFVWRGVDDRDYVCVTGAVRARVQADNAAAASRRQPGGGAFGPDTCVNGYVWRGATLNDHVCVTGDQRTQAAADNAATGRYAY